VNRYGGQQAEATTTDAMAPALKEVLERSSTLVGIVVGHRNLLP